MTFVLTAKKMEERLGSAEIKKVLMRKTLHYPYLYIRQACACAGCGIDGAITTGAIFFQAMEIQADSLPELSGESRMRRSNPSFTGDTYEKKCCIFLIKKKI